MEFTFKISGEVSKTSQAVLRDMAVRMTRKARDCGAQGLKVSGEFSSGKVDSDFGADPPEPETPPAEPSDGDVTIKAPVATAEGGK